MLFLNIIFVSETLVMITWILELTIAFIIGSIPAGILVCQALGLKNPKTYGSTNIGASNVARQSLTAGAITLALDALKGFLAIKFLSPHDSITLAVVAGHCFSPLLAFNGGKGVATALGAVLASHPHIAYVLIFTWATVFSRKRVPASASIFCAILLFIYGIANSNIWLGLTSAIILMRHLPNVINYNKPASTQA